LLSGASGGVLEYASGSYPYVCCKALSHSTEWKTLVLE
jgi:hypothetical protein